MERKVNLKEEKEENVQPNLVAEIIKKDGKYFVSVYTPLGKPDVEHPTTFEPDFQDEIGPFDSEDDAKKQLKQTEEDLRKRGQLWQRRIGPKSKKKARR